MEKQIIKSIRFKRLKCLRNVTVQFSDTLTAIMGVNGSGKTTVIHALACIYQPDVNGKGENHRFPEFFVPNTDALWKGSELYVVNENEGKSGKREILPEIRYGKDVDRWAPRYESRPKRNVYYIGIDTCLPEIEKKTTTSRIQYSTKRQSGKIADNVIHDAAYIVNKPYQELLDNTYRGKHFSGVTLSTGLKYSSLSMGTGEQRVLKILEKIQSAEAYSLILIDEIDLLLHVSALHRLIEKIHEISQKKHIQVVFTTHSTEMFNLTKYVSVQFLHNSETESQTFVYESIGSDLFYSFTGKTNRPIKIYVEDSLAEAVIKEVARKQDMLSSIEVIKFGAIENAFTIASSFTICGNRPDHLLIVLDGDRYKTKEEKEAQIKKKLSGTEEDANIKQQQALSMITQFNLADGVCPEKQLHTMITNHVSHESSLYKAASEINAVADSHQWIYEIKERTNLSESDIIHEIFDSSYSFDDMKQYVKPITEWFASIKKGN